MSWLPFLRLQTATATSRPSPVAEEQQIPSPGTSALHEYNFNDLADKFDELQKELHEANAQLSRHQTEIQSLDRVLALKTRDLASQEKALRRFTKDIERLNSDLKRERRQFSESQSRLKAQHTIALATEKGLHAKLQEESKVRSELFDDLEARYVDAKFDLEYLRCVAKPSGALPALCGLARNVSLPPQPFVVVLVDGDAYDWAPDIFSHAFDSKGAPIVARNIAEHQTPGSIAASRIRQQVVAYILEGKGQIPISSKIITRVFCNLTGYESHLNIPARRMNRSPRAFAVDFTQKMPLFDYFDAGRGKERVDDKIRENFNLYLSTPNCAAIFVAACLDNGFARMLEPYTGHEPSYEKIILVSPGHMALEMFKLNFKSVSWPSVFAQPDIRPEALQRHRQEALKRKTTALHVTTNEENEPRLATSQDGQAILRSLPPPLADWQGLVRNSIVAFGTGRGLSAAGKVGLSSERIVDEADELKAWVD